jgi:Holliday junction resolvase-like predicted endonuclease
MSTVSKGHRAEVVTADYLARRGYQILNQNWRTRYCEIDIVARKNNVIHFVEVKYRATNNQGAGLDYITPAKLNRMSFAAQVWTKQYGWQGDYVLSAAAVSGPQFVVTAFIESLV